MDKLILTTFMLIVEKIGSTDLSSTFEEDSLILPLSLSLLLVPNKILHFLFRKTSRFFFVILEIVV